MLPSSPAGSLTDMDVLRTLMGACSETGGMYDCEGANDPWGVASDENVCDYSVIMTE